MKVSSFLPLYASRAQGWIFLVLGFSMFSGFLYTAIIAKFLPVSENHIVAAIQKDRLGAEKLNRTRDYYTANMKKYF